MYGWHMFRALLVFTALLAVTASTAYASPARVPVVPGILTVYAPCPDPIYNDAAGCARADQLTIYVMRDGDDWTRLHEMGHVFAFRALGDTGLGFSGPMKKFARITRHEINNDGGRDSLTVREQFADAYAACAFGYRPKGSEWGEENYPTGYGYEPTPRMYDQVCAFIVRAGVRFSR